MDCLAGIKIVGSDDSDIKPAVDEEHDRQLSHTMKIQIMGQGRAQTLLSLLGSEASSRCTARTEFRAEYLIVLCTLELHPYLGT